MKSVLFLSVLIFCCINHLHASGDTLYPQVGKPCPEFLLKNVNYYKKKEVTLADFKGKWLVLDFWNKYCSACVESFPETNAMQKTFENRVQFMLVGIQDPEGQIKTMYERFKNRMNLKLPCSFDSSLSNYWGIYNTPHIIVIDDKGIVQAVVIKVDSISIEKFLKGERPVLPVIPYVAQAEGTNIGELRIPYDMHKPFMVYDNGAKSDTGYLYRSVLTKWNQENQYVSRPLSIYKDPRLFKTFPKGEFDVLGASLKGLYLYAYFGAENWRTTDTSLYGKYSPIPLLEVKDSSLFEDNVENRYCYSLKLLPNRASKENLQTAMQKDLEIFFGYDVSIEKRKVPCWRLVAKEKAATILKAKGGSSYQEVIIPNAVFKLHNVLMSQLVQGIVNRINAIVIDETNITDSVDITLNFMDSDDLIQSLRTNGLDLVKSEKEMKVLVIKDAQN